MQANEANQVNRNRIGKRIKKLKEGVSIKLNIFKIKLIQIILDYMRIHDKNSFQQNEFIPLYQQLEFLISNYYKPVEL